MELMPVKQIELSGGPADGMTHDLPPNRTKVTLSSEKLNRRLIYEYTHTKKDGSGTEVFAFVNREPISQPQE
jgi:hypothetical protein